MVLSSFHCELLRYISDHPCSSGEEILKKFHSQEVRVESALKYLHFQNFLRTTSASNEENFHQQEKTEQPFMEKWGFDMCWRFVITETGSVALEQYEYDHEQLQIAKKSITCAIIVSVASALVQLVIDYDKIIRLYHLLSKALF